jgi:hypothetical protein
MINKKKSLSLVLIFSLMVFVYGGSLFYRHFHMVSQYPITAWEEDHFADCGVVLTGSANRINDGLEQLYLKRVKKVIISGVHPLAQLRDIFPQRAFFGDLDEDDIILEKRSLTTYGNALQTLPLVEALNCKDVVLITSKLHMHRAYSTFRRYFPAEIPIYPRSTVGRRMESHWTSVGGEAIKSVFYDLWFF